LGKRCLILLSLLALAIAALIVAVKIPAMRTFPGKIPGEKALNEKVLTQSDWDSQGGTQLTLQVLPTEKVTQIGEQQLEAVQQVIERRVHSLGVAEALVQSIDPDKLSIQLPGINDSTQAERVLGEMAQLEFRMQKPGTEGAFSALQTVVKQQELEQKALATGGDEKAIAAKQAAIAATQKDILALFGDPSLTGAQVKDASAQPIEFTVGEPSGAWEIGIEFTQEGAYSFEQLTRELAGTGRGLGIFLDNQLLSSPSVGENYAKTGIKGGRASISGEFDAESAHELEIQLRGGSLPFPVKIIENRRVEPR
jgi:preprotein translocase subunit SecD